MTRSRSFRSWVVLPVLATLCASAVHAAEVRVTSDTFVKEEVGRLVAEFDRQGLVAKNRAGALTLDNPTADQQARATALGEAAIGLFCAAYARAGDSARYGIARVLCEQGTAGCRALADLLRDRRVPGRRWILQATAGTYTAHLVAALREVANDPDRSLAERAIGELGEVEDDQGIVVLRTIVKGPDRQRALAAARALASLKDGSGAGLLLQAVLQTRSTGKDAWAATDLIGHLKMVQALGTSGAPEAVDPLVALFVEESTDLEADEPMATAQQLSTMAVRGQQVADSMKSMLEASYTATALTSLTGRKPRPTVEALVGHANVHVRRMATEILGALGDQSAVPVLARVLGVGQKTEARGRLSDAFASIAVGTEPEREQILAATSLRMIGGPKALAALDAARRIASQALAPWLDVCLAALDDPKGLQKAVAYAKGRDSELKISAIAALGLARSRVALDTLAELTDSNDVQIRLVAASSLSRPGNRAAQPALTRLLQKSLAVDDRQSQSVAALGLGFVGDERTVAPLEKLVTSPDPSIRKAAVVALFYVTGRVYRYANPWGVPSTFEPTTFHARLRAEKLGRLDGRR